MSSSPSGRRTDRTRSVFRSTAFESFEARLVFSADPLIDPADIEITTFATSSSTANSSLARAHEQTGADYVFQEYGFDGTGQTVAVIDTGIAWDHYALGGGLGTNYRVVGGWDFAEGDSNPYDDGPAGFHGTHVAGIVGSSDASHRGVASDVDLVALRVFDDAGNGNLRWVEQALQWVHDHRDAFENPITTVNLSLGVDWNGSTLPGWASLEDELAQLEMDGIFISVAAGNAFNHYNETGLAYPAVSDHVVPVASHDSDGRMSDFSQRDDRVIVAPGRSIHSTVPDHLLSNGHSGGFLGASGTSMAAPYVAGASAIVREAMQFMGMTNINQDSIYQWLRDTSDQLHDSATGGVYAKLNLGAAIDAIVDDLHGNVDNPQFVGLLANQTQFQGTIGKLSDVDAFQFTAGGTGIVTLDVAQTHELSSIIRVNGQSLQFTGGRASFDVLSGHNYTVSISTGDGAGHYTIGATLTESAQAVSLGTLTGQANHQLAVDGSTLYRMTSSNAAILALQAHGGTGTQVELLDASMQSIATGVVSASGLRLNTSVATGSDFYIRLSGDADSVQVQLENNVSFAQGVVHVAGTNQNDHIGVFESSDGSHVKLVVNGTDYRFQTNHVSDIQVNGQGGTDHIYYRSQGSPTAVRMEADTINASSAQFTLAARGFESSHVVGTAVDKVTLLDTAGNDHVHIGESSTRIESGNASHIASGFGTVQAVSRSGHDQVTMTGSAGRDYVYADADKVFLKNATLAATAFGFDVAQVNGGAGQDVLELSLQRDSDFAELTGRSAQARMGSQSVRTNDFETSVARGNGTDALIRMRGTAESEYVWSSTGVTSMQGQSYENSAVGARRVQIDASSGGGNDLVQVADSTGADTVVADHFRTHIVGGGADRQFTGFAGVTLVSRGGNDTLQFTGTRGRDVLTSEADAITVQGARYHFQATGFENVTVSGNGGRDSAQLIGGNGNDTMAATRQAASVSGDGFRVTARDFERVRLDGGGGQNTLALSGLRTGDRLTADVMGLMAWLDQTEIEATNLVWLDASVSAGETAESEMGAVDFWYALHGNWEAGSGSTP